MFSTCEPFAKQRGGYGFVIMRFFRSATLGCLFTGVLCFASWTASGSVVIVPPPADLVPSGLPVADPGLTVLWDVDGDNIADFNIVFRQPQTGGGLDWQASVFPLNGAGVISTGAGGDFSAVRLAAGSSVDSSGAYLPSPGQALLAERFNGVDAGDFILPNSNGYIGFRFAVGGNLYYGWLNLTVTRSTGAGVTGIHFINAAYESVAGNAITIPSGAPLITSAVPPSPVTVGTPYTHTFTATGNGTIQFNLTSGVLPAGLTLTAAGLLSGTASSAGTGFFPNLTVTASNGIPPDDTQTFSLNTRTVVANYLASFGLSGANALPTADPNFDGVTNLMAYALGLNPNTQNANLLPIAAIKNYAGLPFVYLTFQRSSVATDLTYYVEASADLQSWTIIATSSGGAPTTGAGFVAETGSAPNFTVEVRDTQPVNAMTAPRRFLRLRVTTP